MEKDTAAAPGRPPLGPGAPPLGVAPAHLKAASKMVGLQRTRSLGSLHRKGDPLSRIQKLCKETGKAAMPPLLWAQAWPSRQQGPKPCRRMCWALRSIGRPSLGWWLSCLEGQRPIVVAG